MDPNDFSNQDHDVPFDTWNENDATIDEQELASNFATATDDDVPFDVDGEATDERTASAAAAYGDLGRSVIGNDDPFDFAGRTSQPFIGRWNRLVSTTNWEKGRIICDWRQSLIDSGAPQTAYSDEVWSRLVGSVTSQHVGRLRRVFLRFGSVHGSYEGLFWTHFQAALDWDDAEMWLQGSLDNGWSVSRMRRQRWETLGAIAGQEPAEADVVAAELDEDFEPAKGAEPGAREFDESSAGPRAEGPDFGDDQAFLEDQDASGGSIVAEEDEPSAALPETTPAFEKLGRLPEDLAEALEAFQVAIVRHRSAGWADTSPEAVLSALDGLKKLVLSHGA